MKNTYSFSQEAFVNYEIERQLKENNVSVDFPKSLTKLTEQDFAVAYRPDRKDFRELDAFTVDAADCQDMDDAISLEVTETGYVLGVHIADVSAYVQPGSALDEAALNRGTSVYLPGLTIPMLPDILTNNLCSLVPGKDRNTTSILINLNRDAEVLGYTITKGLIRSRVKGVYSEINHLFEGTASDSVKKKYAPMQEKLMQMRSLSKQLRSKRGADGANLENNSKVKITFENGCIQVAPDIHEDAQKMIEEFMVLANRLVAEYMVANKLPCIFRTQPEKDVQAFYMPVVNRHAELALHAYCHFTSPIRRYPDILVHRALGYHLAGYSRAEIISLMDETPLSEMSEVSTKRSRRESNIEKSIDRYCCARYFSQRRDEQFVGKITGMESTWDEAMIRMNDFNLMVIGTTALKEYQGQSVSFTIAVDNKNRLRARNIKLIAAAA